jgi:2'-5' RNA ligase
MSQSKYSIWLMPSDSDKVYLSSMIQSLSEVYDAPPFEPHCTIYSSVDDLESAKTIIDQLNFKPFEAKVNGLSQSDYIWKTIIFELETNPHLLLLHYLFDQAMLDPYTFEPHVSLIYKKMGEGERERIIQSLSIMSKINFDRIAIVNTSEPVSEWTSVFEKQF